MNFKKILCLVMALVMVGSVALTPIFAATEEDDDTYLFAPGRQEEFLEEVLAAIPEVLWEEAKVYYELAEDIAYDIYENHEEYYAGGYKYALENGYIDTAIDYIKIAIDSLGEINLDGVDISDELKEKLEIELDAIIPTLEKLLAVLESGEADNFDGFVNALLSFESDLYTHLNNIYAICEQAGIELNQDILLPAFNYAIDVLHNQVIPAIEATINAFIDAVVNGAIERLEPYFEKAAELLNISKETYELLVEAIVKLNLLVENSIDEIIEAHNKLVAALIAINGNVEAAIRDAVEFINNVVDTILAINAKIENTITSTVEGVKSFVISVTNAYNYTVALLVKTYGMAVDAVTVAGQIYEYVTELLITNRPLIEEGIADAAELASKIYADIVEILKDAYAEKDDVYAVASKVAAYVIDALCEIDSAIKNVFDSALNGSYELTDDSLYVALGNAAYADALAGKLNLSDKLYKFDVEGDYIGKVAEADLITIKLDNGEFVTLAEAQIMGVFANLVKSNSDLMAWYNNYFFGGVIKETIADLGIDMEAEVVELDWSKHLDAEGQAVLDEALADLKNELLVNGVPEYYEFDFNGLIEQGFEENGMGGIFTWSFEPMVIPVAELLVFAVENALYSYADFTDDLVMLINEINEASPEATVVLTGVTNPLVGYEFLGLDLSAYANYVAPAVDALNAQLYLVALVDENTIFVESNGANDIYDALNVYCEHTYDGCLDTDCNRCLEVRVAPGHVYTNYVFNEGSSDCTKDGTETAKCDNCGEAEDTRTAANTKGDHKWLDATCTSPKKCEKCNATEGEKKDHEMGEWTVTKDATSKEQGLEEKKCLHCDYRETRPIDNKGLSALAIAGIVVACVAVVGGASAGLAAYLKKKNKI